MICDPNARRDLAVTELDAPVLLTRADGTILDASPAAEELFRSLGIERLDPAAMPESLRRALTETPPGASFEWYPDEPGDPRCLGGTRYHAGPERVLTVMRELSSVRRSLARTLWSQRLAVADALVGEIAHELRNALASVVYNVGVARDLLDGGEATDTAPALAAVIGDIDSSANRLDALIDRLVARARPTGASQVIDLRSVLRRLAEIVARRREHPMRIEVALGDDARFAQGAPLAVEEALLYLVTDAGDAGATRLAIRTTRREGMVAITLTSEGTAPSDLPPTTRGVGLALPLAREALAASGGQVAVERDGTFVLALPPHTSGTP